MPRFPDMTPALMLSYGTDEERAAWEVAGRPAVIKAEWKQALDAAYVVLVPDDISGLIGSNGEPWQDDGRAVIDLN